MTTTPQAALLSDTDIARIYRRVYGGTQWGSTERMFAAEIEQEILAKLQATQAEPPKDVSMPQYWSVDVFSDGAKIVSIGNDWLSGERPLDEIDERTIIGAAQHLLSFVGYGLPPTSFDPDAQAEPVQAAFKALADSQVQIDPEIAKATAEGFWTLFEPVQAGELPDEREAFEHAERASNLHRDEDVHDDYANPYVQASWEGWQKRAALAARKPAVPMTPEQWAEAFLTFMAEPNWSAGDYYVQGIKDAEKHHSIGLEVKP